MGVNLWFGNLNRTTKLLTICSKWVSRNLLYILIHLNPMRRLFLYATYRNKKQFSLIPIKLGVFSSEILLVGLRNDYDNFEENFQ